MRVPFRPLLAFTLLLCACRHAPPAAAKPIFPMAGAWTTPLPATVEGPLASDASSVYVATREGSVRSLDASAGRIRWTVEERPGVVAVGEGLLVVRQQD